MARVICSIPTATSPINGVEYTEDRGELVSAEMPEDVADTLATIPGFRKVATDAPPAPVAPTPREPRAPKGKAHA